MPTVMVVDDALFMRVAIGNMFKVWGFEVIAEAANGRDAVKNYFQFQPDIVTMDLTMPIMSGIDALREIMQSDSNAKIIMITALGQQRVIVEAIESGAKDFITKPFTEQKLKEVVYNVLNIEE